MGVSTLGSLPLSGEDILQKNLSLQIRVSVGVPVVVV